MELNKKINVRISANQLRMLMSAVMEEKTTLSNLLRNIINGYNEENYESTKKKGKVIHKRI
jgi:hypothetical protein